MNPLTLNLRPIMELNHEQFERIAAANRDLRLELTATGEGYQHKAGQLDKVSSRD